MVINVQLKMDYQITSSHQINPLDVLGSCSRRKIHTLIDHSKVQLFTVSVVQSFANKITNFSHENPKILPDILHAIGNTPLVKLNHIPQLEGIKCDMCKYNFTLAAPASTFSYHFVFHCRR